MPGWSHEIANEFILRASVDDRFFDQMQLQKLVYIAHGWCLASIDQPLTGDRPEAWEFGPVYTRLSDAVVRYGTEAITAPIPVNLSEMDRSDLSRSEVARADLSPSEVDLVAMVYEHYGALSAPILGALTQRPGTPWWFVYAGGRGLRRDIAHRMIRKQFVEIAEEEEAKEAIPDPGSVDQDGS